MLFHEMNFIINFFPQKKASGKKRVFLNLSGFFLGLHTSICEINNPNLRIRERVTCDKANYELTLQHGHAPVLAALGTF